MNSSNRFQLPEDIWEHIPPRRDAIMVFGSAARGDSDKHSDIDVLVLRRGTSFSERRGQYNIAYYSPAHLRQMAENGSLFVRHLLDDGQILEDPSNVLVNILQCYIRPASYVSFRNEICAVLPLFDISQERFEQFPKRWFDASLFCLRSLIYIAADEEDTLSFSIKKLASDTGWEEAKFLLAARQFEAKQFLKGFTKAIEFIEAECKKECSNPYLTVEAYCLNEYEDHPLVLSLTLRLLLGGRTPISYDLFSPVHWVSGT